VTFFHLISSRLAASSGWLFTACTSGVQAGRSMPQFDAFLSACLASHAAPSLFTTNNRASCHDLQQHLAHNQARGIGGWYRVQSVGLETTPAIQGLPHNALTSTQPPCSCWCGRTDSTGDYYPLQAQLNAGLTAHRVGGAPEGYQWVVLQPHHSFRHGL